MAVTTTRVTSWSELVHELFEDSWQPELGRFRSHFAFRGIADERYRLETSLMRLGGDYATLERHLIRNFMKYAYRDVGQKGSFWHWLALAQHHGLPTRLLDFTFSPFVALHFATTTLDSPQCDAAVWCVNYAESNKILARSLVRQLEENGSPFFTADMLDRVAPDLAAFQALDPDPFLVFFEPPSIDDRIVNQFALFSVMSSPHEILDEWLESRPEEHRKVIVPGALRWEVRDKLDQANINERVLFPGLDGLCTWLKRHYGPGPGTDRGETVP